MLGRLMETRGNPRQCHGIAMVLGGVKVVARWPMPWQYMGNDERKCSERQDSHGNLRQCMLVACRGSVVNN